VLNFEDGRPSISITAGTGVILDAKGLPVVDANGNTVRTLADLLKLDTSGNIKSAITNAVTGTAQKVLAAGGDATAAKAATTQLALIMSTMSKADPVGAAALVNTAVSALTQGGGSSPTINNAISAAVAGATQGNSAVDAAAVRTAATTAATGNGVTLASTVVNPTNTTLINSVTTERQKLDVTVLSRSG